MHITPHARARAGLTKAVSGNQRRPPAGPWPRLAGFDRRLLPFFAGRVALGLALIRLALIRLALIRRLLGLDVDSHRFTRAGVEARVHLVAFLELIQRDLVAVAHDRRL